ncbi:hypothetical protein EON68_02620, partial [archaeon]
MAAASGAWTPDVMPEFGGHFAFAAAMSAGGGAEARPVPQKVKKSKRSGVKHAVPAVNARPAPPLAASSAPTVPLAGAGGRAPADDAAAAAACTARTGYAPASSASARVAPASAGPHDHTRMDRRAPAWFAAPPISVLPPNAPSAAERQRAEARLSAAQRMVKPKAQPMAATTSVSAPPAGHVPNPLHQTAHAATPRAIPVPPVRMSATTPATPQPAVQGVPPRRKRHRGRGSAAKPASGATSRSSSASSVSA